MSPELDEPQTTAATFGRLPEMALLKKQSTESDPSSDASDHLPIKNRMQIPKGHMKFQPHDQSSLKTKFYRFETSVSKQDLKRQSTSDVLSCMPEANLNEIESKTYLPLPNQQTDKNSVFSTTGSSSSQSRYSQGFQKSRTSNLSGGTSAMDGKSESTADVSPTLKRNRIAFHSLPQQKADEEMKEQNASDESDDELPSPEPTIIRAESFQSKPLFATPNPELEKNCSKSNSQQPLTTTSVTFKQLTANRNSTQVPAKPCMPTFMSFNQPQPVPSLEIKFPTFEQPMSKPNGPFDMAQTPALQPFGDQLDDDDSDFDDWDDDGGLDSLVAVKVPSKALIKQEIDRPFSKSTIKQVAALPRTFSIRFNDPPEVQQAQLEAATAELPLGNNFKINFGSPDPQPSSVDLKPMFEAPKLNIQFPPIMPEPKPFTFATPGRRSGVDRSFRKFGQPNPADFDDSDNEDGLDFDEFSDDDSDWDSDTDLANLPVLTLRRANAQVWIKFDVPQVFG